MNKKAESFKQYLEDKQIEAFKTEELQDESNSVAFRSNIEVNGQTLPTVVILDDSVFSFIRVLLAPNAASEKNEAELLKLLNSLTAKYKPFKFYTDGTGSIYVDCSLINETDNVNGDLVYAMLELLVNHLSEEYKGIMKKVWL